MSAATHGEGLLEVRAVTRRFGPSKARRVR